MSEKKPQQRQPGEKEREIERHEDQEGIPGYGQPPPEVRTTHPEGGPEFQWDENETRERREPEQPQHPVD